ncbi:MAG: DUF4278 domain-containing protein [Gloeocapsa sp. DLM2.Bin57]|nr:MAG: DUF4278 domain-containing protein [Gloeocapsa sp. DLM2.Bin57]
MNLSYRGCQYQKFPVSLVGYHQQINLKYRGVNYSVNGGMPTISKPNVVLKYRGISYQVVDSYIHSEKIITFPHNSVIA